MTSEVKRGAVALAEPEGPLIGGLSQDTVLTTLLPTADAFAENPKGLESAIGEHEFTANPVELRSILGRNLTLGDPNGTEGQSLVARASPLLSLSL
jgi:hypothetical protein